MNLAVTDVVEDEVPVGDGEQEVRRRAYIRQKLQQFPVVCISPSRSAERDGRAEEFLRLLWPNVADRSRKHGNSLRDCRHLACHHICGRDIFVTLDQEMARKARAHAEQLGVTVLEPDDALARVETAPPSKAAVGAWNPVVRRAKEDDRGEIKKLLDPIRGSYDDFDAWLGAALTQKELWVAQLDDGIGAVAVWSKKTETTVKLATFEVVPDDGLDAFLAAVGRQVFDLPEHPGVRAARSWFLPPSFGALAAARAPSGAVAHVEVLCEGEIARKISISEMEELVYPARLALQGRKAYMIPIMPQWADRLMHVPRPQGALFSSNDKLALRTDNTYYGHPFYLDQDICEAPALFYVSQPDKMVAGFARIVERTVAEPEDLYLRYERTGIYNLEDIRGHVKKAGPQQGCAMAIRFAWWVPFPKPVGLDQLREMGLHHPQHIEAIDYEDYERLLKAGGVTW